jgi:hypothetical protein
MRYAWDAINASVVDASSNHQPSLAGFEAFLNWEYTENGELLDLPEGLLMMLAEKGHLPANKQSTETLVYQALLHFKSPRFLETLLDAGWPLGTTGLSQSLLHFALQAWHLAAVDALLKRGASVLSNSVLGHTVLHNG